MTDFDFRVLKSLMLTSDRGVFSFLLKSFILEYRITRWWQSKDCVFIFIFQLAGDHWTFGAHTDSKHTHYVQNMEKVRTFKVI